jgi:hypothetical protein
MAISSARIPAWVTAALMQLAAACHHSDGSCSDHNGLGVWSVWGDDSTATTLPASSISKALLEVVEVSIPRRYIALPHPEQEVYGELVEAFVL